MRLDEIVDLTIDTLIEAGICAEGSIFAGRIYPINADSGLWCVYSAPGMSDGGNNAKHKTIYNLVVCGFDVDAGNLYRKSEEIRKSLIRLPTVNPKTLSVTVSTMSDMDVVGMEERMGTWSVVATTLTPGWEIGE